MLKKLHRIVLEVGAAPDLDTALRTLVRQIRRALQVDVCSVYLSEDDGTLVLMATEGLRAESVGRVRLARGEGLIGLVAEQETPVNVDDAPEHPDFRFVPATGEEPFHAFLGVPAVHQRRLVGVVAVQQIAARRFTDTHIAFLTTLAAQIGAIIAFDRAAGVAVRGATRIHRSGALEGLPGAPGVAIGQAVVVYPVSRLESVPDRPAADIAAEEQRLRAAILRTREELATASARLEGTLADEDRALFDAYAMMLDDASLQEEAVRGIQAGNWAPGALRQAIEKHAGLMEQLDDPYLRERAADIRDLGRRVLLHIEQQPATIPTYPAQTVLVGEQVAAVDIADVPVGQLVGVVSGQGSALSHVAILARSLNVPAVMGLGEVPLAHLDGRDLLVDGYRGHVHAEPELAMRREFERLAREEQELAERLEELRKLPAETPDGWRVPIDVNTGLLEGIAPALRAGADGVGLYRTELPFMVRDYFPTEDEQYSIYRHMLESFAPRPVTLRTLDAGGDKPLPYFPVVEANPFLGWRGLRMTLDHPEIFLVQLRAALRAAAGLANLKLLLPMVSTLDEVEEALNLIRRAESELREEGVHLEETPVGIMIEVPSAAYEAGRLARHVDFMSIGTNDLTQYMLAVDRGNQRVAKLFEPLNPAVLRLVAQVVEAGHQAGKPVGVCGEAAGDPAVAVLLLAMGVDRLSVNAADVPRLKWIVRSFTRAKLRELLEPALHADRAADVRRLLQSALEDAGLGGLMRPGK